MILICFGQTVYFDINNLGKQGDTNTSYNHVSCIDGGIIKNFQSSKFTEYVITHDTNNPTITEDGDTFYFGDSTSGQQAEIVKKEIIYIES